MVHADSRTCSRPYAAAVAVLVTAGAVAVLAAAFPGIAGAQAPSECELPGPDASGYTCTVEPGAFVDITETGTVVSLADDEVSGPIPIGFPFPFYGATHESLHVSSNGFVTFSATDNSGCCAGQNLPDPTEPNYLVAGYWSDLYPPGGGAVLYGNALVEGEPVFVVEWSNVPHCCSASDPATFEIVLFPDGTIRIEYATTSSGGRHHSAGIEGPDGLDGVRYASGDFAPQFLAVQFALAEPPEPPTGPAPDLVLASFHATTTTPAAGTPVAFRANVSNTGLAPATDVRVRFTQDGTTLAEPVIPLLAPGATVEVDGGMWTIEAGHHVATARADPDNAIAETDETNNRRFLDLQAGPPPDLFVTSAGPVDEPPYQAGSSMRFFADISNGGPSEAPPSHVRFMVDGSQDLGAVSVPAIPAGESVRVESKGWTATSDLHYLWVAADSEAEVYEYDEFNNDYYFEFFVESDPTRCDTPGPDAAGYRCRIVPATYVDLSLTGTPVPLAPFEQREIPIGFAFPFYGALYDRVMVADSGVLHFDGADAYPHPYGAQRLPDPSPPNRLISAYWGDLDVSGGTVRSQTLLRADGHQVFVVEWRDVPHFCGWCGPPATFEIVLVDDGTIQVNYGTTEGSSRPTSAGIENTDGSTGLTFRFGSVNVTSTSVEYLPPLLTPLPDAAVLSVTMAPEGAVEPGTNVTFTAVVKNQGSVPAAPVEVEFQLDGQSLGRQTIPLLAAGESAAVVSDPWVAAGMGAHTLRVLVDPAARFPDANRENNEKTLTVVVTGADLVTDLYGTPGMGGQVFYGYVANNGGASAPESTLELYVDGLLFETVPVPALSSYGVHYFASQAWTPTGGAHTVRAVADATGLVEETNETNNEDAESFSALAQLRPLGVTLEPDPRPGDHVYFKVTARNDGFVDSGPFHVRFDIWEFFTVYYTLEDVAVPSLAPGETAEVRTTFPWYANRGNHAVFTKTDIHNEVLEHDERYEAHEYDKAFIVGTPDIMTESLVADAGFSSPSGETVLTARVWNRGSKPIETPFQVRFSVDGVYVGETTVTELGMGERRLTTLRVPAQFGSHYAYAEADPYHAVPESDELNNIAQVTYFTDGPAKPDLRVRTLTMTPANPAFKEATFFEVTVTNYGRQAAGAFSVAFDLADGGGIGETRVAGLGPGATLLVRSPAWPANGGANQVHAVADSRNEVDEHLPCEGCDDNDAYLFIDPGLPPLPDLQAYEILWTPLGPRPGDVTTFAADVYNNHDSDPGPFNVTFLMDGEPIGTVRVTDVGPHGYARVPSPPWVATAGRHAVSVVVDDANAVLERSEANNARTRSFASNPADCEVPGPDAAGYTCQVIPYAFVDGRTAGTPVAMHDEEFQPLYPTVALPFPFPFYGEARTEVSISSDGFLGFDPAAGEGCCDGQQVPSTEAPNLLIAGLWQDFLAESPPYRGVYTLTTTIDGMQAFVIEFHRVRHSSQSEVEVTYQYQLFPDGRIRVQYQDAPGISGNAYFLSDGAAGIENGDGTVGVRYAFGGFSLREIGVEYRPVIKPDLRVSAVSVAPAVPTLGDEATFTATVVNEGNGASPLTLLRFTVDGALFADLEVPAIPMGGSLTLSTTGWRATMGDHVVAAVADATGLAEEHDESNNTASTTVHVTAVNLVASALTGPASVHLGNSATYQGTVTNNGDLPAGPFTVQFFMDGVLLAEASGDGLEPGASRNFTTPSWTGERGSHNLSFVVDSGNAVTEGREDDNVRNLTVRVVQPDLRPLSISISPNPPQYGDNLFFNSVIKNEGDEAAVNINVRYLVDGQVVSSSHWFRTLAPGQSNTFPAGIGWKALGGDNHTVTVIVDYTNSHDESNETNNELGRAFTYRQSDLTVVSFGHFPDPIVAGDRVGFGLAVKNLGGRAAPSTASFAIDGVVLSNVSFTTIDSGWTHHQNAGISWIATAGTHVATIRADSREVLWETNETNNAVSYTFHVTQAELRPTSLTAAPADPSHGEATRFNVTLENTGTGPAKSFVVRFLVDEGGIGDVTVASLAAGSTTSVLSPPWAAVGGDHAVRVVVDAAGTVVEANETNNGLDLGIHVRQADLALDGFTVSNDAPIAGDEVVLAANVTNLGDAPAAASLVRFEVDDVTVAEAPVPSLGPGETATVAVSWTASRGAHVLRAVADGAAAVVESDEANNVLETSLTVGQPDLVALDLRVTDGDGELEAGENLVFTARVENRGDGPARAFKATFTLDGGFLSEVSVPGLAPGANATLTSVAWKAAPGNHSVALVVDGLGEVTEPNEEDNTMRVSLQVAQAELRPTVLSASPASPDVGTATTFTATIENGGDAKASNFKVRFLVDGILHSETTVERLKPFRSMTVTSAPWTARVGDHTVTVQVDPTNVVSEATETNNAKALPVHTKAPDLVPTALQSTPAAPKAGDDVVFEVMVRNAGDLAAGAFQVRFVLDGERTLGAVAVPGLAAGGSLVVTSDHWLALPGHHDIAVFVDAMSVVTEVSESNNSATKGYEVGLV